MGGEAYPDGLPCSLVAGPTNDLTHCTTNPRAAHAAEHVLRREAAGRGWAGSSCWAVEVGTIIRHRRYGYRGVVYGYDPCCMASEAWQQRMNVAGLESGAGTLLVEYNDRMLRQYSVAE